MNIVEKVKYGYETKHTEYQLDKSVYFCNHGSYGAVPNVIFEKKKQLQHEIEQSPDKWFRITSFDLWLKSKKHLAEYLRVNSENILLCDNATESINCALKSIQFNRSSDAILCTRYTYPAILNTIDYVATYRFESNNRVNVFKVPCVFPIASKEKLIEDFDKTIEEIIVKRKLRLRLAVIDHISSATAVLYPVNELINLIRKWTSHSRETLILVDGAHAIGQTEINLNLFDCDYYVSNLHKWFCAPKGCSFLYLKDKNRLEVDLEPNYISHGYKKDLSYNFYQRATTDKTAWFLVDECINFYETKLGGLKSLQEYTSRILKEAVKLLVDAWQTRTLELPLDLEAPFMKMIKLPKLKSYEVDEANSADKVCPKLMNDLITNYNLVACVIYVQNELYCRISCFAYNQMEDYIKLRDTILALV